jgi:hypothetical protein
VPYRLDTAQCHFHHDLTGGQPEAGAPHVHSSNVPAGAAAGGGCGCGVATAAAEDAAFTALSGDGAYAAGCAAATA